MIVMASISDVIPRTAFSSWKPRRSFRLAALRARNSASASVVMSPRSRFDDGLPEHALGRDFLTVTHRADELAIASAHGVHRLDEHLHRDAVLRGDRHDGL